VVEGLGPNCGWFWWWVGKVCRLGQRLGGAFSELIEGMFE
jgi:hypothetical protein